MRRRAWAVMVVATVVAGCGGSGASQRSVEDATLVVALPSQPENLNPIASDNIYEGNQKVFNGLLRYAKDLSPQPDLAAELPTRSRDGRRVTVKLRRDVRFHDGTPLTAKDVAFTYNAILDEDSASPLASLLDSLEEARAIDDATVEFALDRPDPAFYDKLQIGIVPAHLLEGRDIKTAAFNRRPVGTGPYVLEEFQPGGRIVLEANRDYFRGAPEIKRIVLTAVPDENARVALLENGTIDAAGIVPKLADRVRRNGDYDVLEIPTADARVLALPNRDPVLRDPAVRRALSFAVDREQLVEGALAGAGEPAYGPIMKGHPAYSPVAETRYDPAEAERRLDAAGWRRGGDGPRAKNGRTLAFTVMYPADDSVRKDVALAFASDMAKIGVEVNLEGLTFEVIEKRQDDGATEFGYGTPYDPDLELYSLLHSKFANDDDAFTNYPRTSNPAIDARARHRPLDARRIRAQAGLRRAPGRARAGRELAVARPAAPHRRRLQAREGHRSAGRAARSRLLARHDVEPRGLDARAGAMTRLVLRRLALLPLLLLAVAAGTFVLAEVSPFDPVDAYVGAETQIAPERRAEIAQAWGFDQPLPERFGRWIANVAQGDLGNSVVAGGQPVAGEIVARAGSTLVLIGGALVLVLVGGLVFGVLAAALRGTAVDWLIRALSYFSAAAPSFWIGLLALYVFSIELGWLPAGGTSDPRSVDSGVDLEHIVLPMLVLALTQYAWFTLFVRNTLLEVMNEDYVQFARAHGIRESAVLLRHALPTALIPFVTLAGVNLAELVGGTILIESIFGWPGVGLLALDAARGEDIPMIVGITLAASVLVVLGNLLADIGYRLLDPRVREATA